MSEIRHIFDELIKTYGPQGWWPLLDVKGTNPTKTGSIQGYHPGDYSYPKNKKQEFEICLGSILTQNTSWPNVEKALLNLKKNQVLDFNKIIRIETKDFKEMIKPVGYYNQKADYIYEFINFYKNLKKVPNRKELLKIKGIGPETADSMLLFAFKVPSFIVDAYTKRMFSHLGLIRKDATYHEIKEIFEKNVKKDVIIYQEYHALIVEHAKQYYKKKPYKDKLLSSIF